MAVSPPRPKGPPLNALRAFEAAARLGGFTAAAEELCVTPAAVAQHVKAVEIWFGAQLFVRHSQGVSLTPIGVSALADFSSAFDSLGDAVQKLWSRASPTQIRIAALPSVAQLWLSPKLPKIRSTITSINISITALETRPNLGRDPYDLSIFYEEGKIGKHSKEICKDRIFPVCSPGLAQQLREPADLAEIVCLHDSTWSNDWSQWLKIGLPGFKLDTAGPTFSLFSLAVEEAVNGAGVLMAHEALVASQLLDGRLVKPFNIEVPLDRTLTIEFGKYSRENQTIRKVVNILVANTRSGTQKLEMS